MKLSLVFLSTGFFLGCGLISVGSPERASHPALDAASFDYSASEKELEEQLSLFDKTMEPGYLDKALSIVKEIPYRDGADKILSEVRNRKMKSMCRIFQAATNSINVRYIPQMARMMGKGAAGNGSQEDSVPPKVASQYLYDYIQSGLRMLRFQLRLDILNYMRDAYKGAPSPEERQELLVASQGVDAEFLKLLSDFILMDVSWKIDKKKQMPHHGDKNNKEVLFQDMSHCLQHIQILSRAVDPLYLMNDYPSMNISPPLFESMDGFICAGQSPDSITNPEARRQYLIALRENSRKNEGIGIYRELEDQIKSLESVFFKSLETSDLLDKESRLAFLQLAEKQGMDSRMMENLKEASDARTIDVAIKEFEKTKDRELMGQIVVMLETFHKCRDRIWGRRSMSNYQLERWLMVFHAIDSDPNFKGDGELKAEMEEKIMSHIFKTCEKSRYSLDDARWWLGAYGMRKPLRERIDQYSLALQKEEKAEIEKRIAEVERNFNVEDFARTQSLVNGFRHEDRRRNKKIGDILDFKIRCRFRLLGLLESQIDPAYDTNPPVGASMSLPQSGLMLKAKTAPPSGRYDASIQMRLRELFQDINFNLPDMIENEYKNSKESQQRVLKIVEEMNAKPFVLEKLRFKFEEYNLGESIRALSWEKIGDPVVLAKEIERVSKSRVADKDAPFKSLKENISWKFNLLEAMKESGVHGGEGFEQKLRDSILASIRNDVPDTWDGFLALDDICKMDEKNPQKADVVKIREDRRNGNLRRFDEKLTEFEKTGDFLNLWDAMNYMNYIRISYSLNKDQENRETYRDSIIWYLRLIKAVSRWTPEEILKKQSSPPEQWGKGWSDQITPKRRAELSLQNTLGDFRSSLFSRVRGLCSRHPEKKKEIMETIRDFGVEPAFLKELEDRLSEGSF